MRARSPRSPRTPRRKRSKSPYVAKTKKTTDQLKQRKNAGSGDIEANLPTETNGKMKATEHDAKKAGAAFRKDLPNIILLMLLYTLQGVPMGLTPAIKLILSEKKVPYSLQTYFTLISYPFSLKVSIDMRGDHS